MNQSVDDANRARVERGKMVTRIVAFFIILGALIVFVVRNSQKVAVDLVFWERALPLAWGLLIAGALGLVLGLLLPWLRRLR